MLKIILRLGNIKLSIKLNKLTGLVLLCLAFFSSGLVAQENKFSLSSYGNELSSEPDKFFYFNELEGVLFLTGTIEEGMYTNFRQAITENKVHTIVLNSLGGNVEEGLNIAGTVFDKGIKTYIPKGYECYSACSFIFLAGSEKYALGELGVHQAAYADDISKEKAAIGAVTTVSQLTTADILLRLGEFNTPRFVEQRMLRTAPEDMYVFNEKELNKLGNLNISDESKILFKNIDKFIDDLQSHYAEQDCDNDVAKCTSAQLCQRAAENKSWIIATKATKYVIAAKGKGLTCGVPVPVCPEDIKKCNEEYLCTYGTTSMDTGWCWLNNSLADEAKSLGYLCGIVFKPVIKIETKKPECYEEAKLCNHEELCMWATQKLKNNVRVWNPSDFYDQHIEEAKVRGLSCGVTVFDKSKIQNTCYQNQTKCTTEQLCQVATENTSSGKEWKNNSYWAKHVAEAKKRGLSCSVGKFYVKKETCYSDAKLCNDSLLCNNAVEVINGNPRWLTNPYFKEYVTEAKRRGPLCGVEVRPITKKKTCYEDVNSCNLEQLCLAATNNDTAEGKVWAKNINNKKHVIEAKKRGLSCRVKDHQIPPKMACTSGAKNCSNHQLCERATSDLNGVRVWDDRNDFISYAIEAKKRFLNCGIYEKFNLAFPDFTEYGESNDEINDQIRTLIKNKLLETQSFNEIIVNNDLNRSFNMPVNYSGWQKIGIDFLITGSINVQGNKLSFKYRLFDILHEKPFGKIINFDTKVQSLNEMSNQATNNIKKQFSEYLNSSNRRDTIKMVQEELLKAGCKIGMADGVIGTKTRTALKEITQKLKINYSDSLATTPSYMFNLLKIIKSTDVSKYWCSSDSSELQNYEEGMQLLFRNEFSLAVSKFNKFIKTSSNIPLLAKAYYFNGDAYTGMGKSELALNSYLKSFELEPDGKHATKALQSSYQTALNSLNENDFKLAIIQFDKLINAIPDGPLLAAAHYSKGDAFNEMEKWKAAGKSYLESFKLEPFGKLAAKALMNVGISLGKMQKINEACNILSKVELRFPKSEVAKEAKYEMQLFGCS